MTLTRSFIHQMESNEAEMQSQRKQRKTTIKNNNLCLYTKAYNTFRRVKKCWSKERDDYHLRHSTFNLTSLNVS